jgi:hypothetical protein
MKLVAEVNRKAEEQKKKAAEEEVLKRDAAEATAGCNPHTTNIAVCLHLYLQL